MITVVTFSITYLLYFGVLCRKPEYSLYAFIFLSLFFPRGQYYADSTFIISKNYGVSPFIILQIIASFSILPQIFRRKRKLKISRKLNRFCVLISITIILSIIVEFARKATGGLYGELVDEMSLTYYLSLLCPVIFLYGCAYFITEVKQKEKIFIIILAAGIELTLEVILYCILNLPLPRSDVVIGIDGRFLSLVFGHFPLLVIVPFAAIGSALYFIVTRKKYLLLLFVPFLYLPIIYTYQRAPMVSGLLIASIFFFLLIDNMKFRLGILGGAIVAFLSFHFIAEIVMSNNLFSVYEIRQSYFSKEELIGEVLSRTGAFFRGVELFLYSLPFGFGADYSRLIDMMSSPSIPNFFSFFSETDNYRASSFYWKIFHGIHPTDPHNFFARFLAEYGLFSLITLLIIISRFFTQFILLLKKGLRLKVINFDLYVMKLSVISVLSGVFFHFLFQSFCLYSIFLFFVFLLFSEDQVQFVIDKP